MKYVSDIYSRDMVSGDCIFIPAFYFYQVYAESEVQEQVGDYKPTAIMI